MVPLASLATSDAADVVDRVCTPAQDMIAAVESAMVRIRFMAWRAGVYSRSRRGERITACKTPTSDPAPVESANSADVELRNQTVIPAISMTLMSCAFRA